MKTRVLLVSVVLLTLAAGIFGREVRESDASTPENLIVSEGLVQSQGLSSVDLVYRTLNTETFLDADGSGWIYLNGVIENWGSSDYSESRWCYQFGGSPSDYTMIFAEDAEGILDFDVEWKEDWLTGWGQTCVTAHLRHPIKNGMDYWYGIGIKIADFATVTGEDIINAVWTVKSSSTPVMEYINQAAWPHNREAALVTPEPEEIQWGRAIWRRTYEQAPWELSVEVTVDLGNSMDVTPISQGTYPFDDLDIPWENKPLGLTSGSQTIGSHGCYLTCMTMAMNYYAKIMQLERITPDILNEVARENGGFDGANFNGYLVEELSSRIFGRVILQDELGGLLTKEGVRKELRAGNFVLLGVRNNDLEHYVLAIGIDGEDIIINDPLEQRGRGLLSKNYGGNYVNTRVFKMVTSTPSTGVEAGLHSPGELLVTDSQGRRTGFDPRTGQHYNEIPNSSYWEDQLVDLEPVKIFGVNNFAPEEYTIEVIGTGTGPYTLHVGASGTRGSNEKVVTGEISAGDVHTVDLTYDPNQGIVYKTYLPLVRR